MKKTVAIIFIFFYSVTFAQSSKLRAVSYYSVERNEGKKGYSKSIKTDMVITIDLEKMNIKFSGMKARSLNIIKSGSDVSGTAENKFFNYECLDENGLNCKVAEYSIKMTDGSNEQNLTLEYDNISYVYKIESVK